MEFPDLGKHCSDESCKQLDFLPVKCDSCHKIFCNDHFQYDRHNCPESYRKDNQVPVCPLCNTPIAIRKGLAPDAVIGEHIDNDCKQKKKSSNKCNVKGCKQKELIPVTCEKCRKNFCLRHRLEEDHSCQGFEGSGRGISNTGAAALNRVSKPHSTTNGPFKNQTRPQKTALTSIGGDLDRERRQRQGQTSQPQRTPGQRSQGQGFQSLQAGLSEDEALARAMAMSLEDSQPPSLKTSPSDLDKQQQEEQDMALARALQQSEEEARTNGNRAAPAATRQTSREKSCRLS